MSAEANDKMRGEVFSALLESIYKSAEGFADSSPEPMSEFRHQMLKLAFEMTKGRSASDAIAMLAVVGGQLGGIAAGGAAGLFAVKAGFDVEQSVDRAADIALDQVAKFFLKKEMGL
jgi:hypothetical protein